jgi:hypothetical protein
MKKKRKLSLAASVKPLRGEGQTGNMASTWLTGSS